MWRQYNNTVSYLKMHEVFHLSRGFIDISNSTPACTHSAGQILMRLYCNYALQPVGVQAKDKTKIFPMQRVLKEGASAIFCCVPPRGVNITSTTFNDIAYPLISIGARVKAIAVDNLTIPQSIIKFLSLNCSDTRGMHSYVWNYVSCMFELFLFTFF